MDNNPLFSEFESISAKQWKQKIQVDLKGADYNEALVWESLEGIKVKPFYHQEDLKSGTSFQLPHHHTWQIGQSIYAGNSDLANKKALDVLNRGATTLIFELPDPEIDWSILLDGIPLESTPIHFNLQFLEPKSVEKLWHYIGDQPVSFFLNVDIVGNLARTGNWFHNLEQDHSSLEEIVQLVDTGSSSSVISVDMALYQNAGANSIQQLAYGLSHANEYLNHFDHNLKNTKEKTVVFKVAIGANYFFEIAKLKALRWLWNTLATSYGLTKECHILASPSRRNKTLYDYNVNMLRTTTESMAAVLGGADTVCNLPYDALYHKDNEFGERIARNQLLILKEESYFDEAVKASEGAYFIEILTEQLAQRALDLFKQMETSGGFLNELKKGIPQKKIKESATKEQQLFDSGELVLLGTNTYQNLGDKMKDNLELFPFLKQDKRKTLIEPILEKRLSEALEQERLNNE